MAPESLKPATPIEHENEETFDLKARLLVISTDISTIKRAAVIDNTFIDMLRQKVSILQQTEELSRKLEASRVSQVSAPFIEEVHVPEHLIPQALGFQGNNIRQATNIDGIISIKLMRPSGVFRIAGKTEEAVQQAKAVLDFTAEVIPVPRVYVGPILGSGQRHIQHIVDCVGLSGLKISDMDDADLGEFVAFQLTGNNRAICDARMFLEFHIASLQDLDKLRGVKSPPTIPTKKEVESQEIVDGAEQPESSGDAAGGRQRRTNTRSSQRPRRRNPPNTHSPVELINGDANGIDSAPTDEDNSQQFTNGAPEEIGPDRGHPGSGGGGGGGGGGARPNAKWQNRPRRAQNAQLNNNNNGTITNGAHPDNRSGRPGSDPSRVANNRQNGFPARQRGYDPARQTNGAPFKAPYAPPDRAMRGVNDHKPEPLATAI